MAADLYEAGQQERLNRVYTAVTRLMTYLTILGLAFVVVYADDILRIFGSTAGSARTTLIVLAAGQTLSAVVGPTGFLLVITDHERLPIVNNLVASILNLVLNIVLIQRYGIVGAAAARGVARVAERAPLRYLLGMQPYSWQYWRGAVAIGCAVPVLLLGRTLSLTGPVRIVIGGAAGLAVFAALVWLLGFDDRDRALIEAID